MNNQKGITLIALVITIVVLLILAGVSIALVIGDNGILTEATHAVMENRKSSAEEDVSMALAGLETEYMKEWTKNTSVSRSEYFTKDKIEAALIGKGNIISFEENNPDTGMKTFKYKSNNHEGKIYSFTIDEDGNVILNEESKENSNQSKWASSITAENYGNKVDYVASNGYNDWKIFYSNGENVFLIASNYVGEELVTAKFNIIGLDDPYVVEFSSDTISNTARKDSLFGIRSDSYQLDPSKRNSRSASVLLDTANWTGFKDDKGFGAHVIGGPTIEMWTNSWNAKGELYNTAEEVKYENLIVRNAINGYTIEVDETQSNPIKKLSGNAGYNDSLYFPNKGKIGICEEYFLAAPSEQADVDWLLMTITYDGYINQQLDWGNNTTGVRPVVCLNSTTNAEWDKTNQIWNLK